MCKESIIITRTQIEDKKQDIEILHSNHDPSKRIPIDEQSKMLCNVIVRATHDLHVNQNKNRNEIQIFLKNDCQHLTNNELVRKVKRRKCFSLRRK